MTLNAPTASVRLAQALRDAKAPQFMIDRASAGYYGDFTSELAAPITHLVKDCTDFNLPDIAQRAVRGARCAVRGEFDGR